MTAVLLLAAALAAVPHVAHPSRQLTPGVLCTAADADYDGPRYLEKIPHCARHVTPAARTAAFARYGIVDAGGYELDHLIPLALGGSNDLRNLWPQPITQAAAKDRLEERLYVEMAAGALSQTAAVFVMRRFWRYLP